MTPKNPAAIEAVRAALGNLGMDHSALSMRLVEERVGYPGGSYWNRQVVVSGDGKTEEYDAHLIERGDGLIAAGEIVRAWGLVAKER